MDPWRNNACTAVRDRAIQIAKKQSVAEVEPIHFLLSILQSHDNGATHVIECLGADQKWMEEYLFRFFENWTQGDNYSDPQMSDESIQMINDAVEIARKLRRREMCTEDILYALTLNLPEELPAIFLNNKGITSKKVLSCMTHHF